MEEKALSIKSSLTFGFYLALVSILLSVIIWTTGIIESMGIWGGAIIGLISIVITFILLLIFLINYRNKELGGFMSFGHAFKFAILVIIFSTIITTIYNYIFHAFIDPEYMQNLMAVMQQKTIAYMESVGAPESQIDKAIAKFEEPITMWNTLKQGIMGGLIGGLIVALIAAAIAKKKEATDI